MFKKIALLFGFVLITSGCSRIETGEVGLRVGFDKQIQSGELQPGSFNQTIVGSVLTFPVRDIAVNLDDIRPQTSDNSTLSEMDVTVIYSINPASVAEIYTQKSRSFHAVADGDTYLMFNYMTTLARTAAYKAAALYPAMESVKRRDEIENATIKFVTEALKNEKLDTALTLTKVQVRAIQPAQTIIDTANEAIATQNRLTTVRKQVEIAQEEARRQEMLSKPASITYMRAQTELNYSEAAKGGHVQTMIVPHNFNALGQFK
jgi:hypothetical protein